MTCRWTKRGAGSALWALPLLLAGCRLVWSAEGPAPARPALYTAAGDVRSLASGPDGRLWAGTSGGVLCWTPGRPDPRRWTSADGLDSNDVASVWMDESGLGVCVRTALGQDGIDASGTVKRRPSANAPAGRQTWDGQEEWLLTPAGLVRQDGHYTAGWPDGLSAAAAGNITGFAANAQGVFLATSLGFWRWAAGRWHILPLPAGSPASHVCALGTASQGLLAGLYGDGVYRWNGGRWQRLPGQPAACRFATALTQTQSGADLAAAQGSGLAVGTRSEGVWRENSGCWQRCPGPPTLPSADIGSLAFFQGALWAASFDGGLLRLSEGGGAGGVTRAEGLSSASPRGLLVFRGALYARGADGQLDCSADGAVWHAAFAKADLPRPEVYALGTDGQRLLLGGWAGWAATDGRTWERHYHDPELRGQVVTALAFQGDAVWIGTQKRGLLRYEKGRYTAYQEPQGLTDDWITCLASQGDRLLVGTYAGGLQEKQAERFVTRLKPGMFAIRAITFSPGSTLALAATPLGLYRETGPGRWNLVNGRLSGGLETQAVLPGTAGVWVATRTSLAFIPREDL